jgi:hypothetical protein
VAPAKALVEVAGKCRVSGLGQTRAAGPRSDPSADQPRPTDQDCWDTGNLTRPLASGDQGTRRTRTGAAAEWSTRLMSWVTGIGLRQEDYGRIRCAGPSRLQADGRPARRAGSGVNLSIGFEHNRGQETMGLVVVAISPFHSRRRRRSSLMSRVPRPQGLQPQLSPVFQRLGGKAAAA